MIKQRKFNIIHLLGDLGIGGIQKVVLDICSSADLEKYDLKIYCLNNSLDLVSTYDLDPAIEIKTFDFDFDNDYSLLGYFKHFFINSTVLKKSKEIIEEAIIDKPDILHVHFPPRELNLGLLIQERVGCELIYTQHLVNFAKNSFGTKLLSSIFRKVFRKYNLIAVSKPVQNEIIKYKLLGKNKKLFLIENKLNLNLFIPKTKKKKDYISVVYVARIGNPKAHEDLIRAWSKLNDEPTAKKLFLIGPDGMNNQMQSLAETLVPDGSIVFMGSQYNIAEILNECDFAVFPSHREGLPIALLEKMAMKLPVVASDIPELKNIIENNVNGLIFKCGDINQLAEKITILLQDSVLRKQLGNKARATVEKHYDTSNIASVNEKVYETIMKS